MALALPMSDYIPTFTFPEDPKCDRHLLIDSAVYCNSRDHDTYPSGMKGYLPSLDRNRVCATGPSHVLTTLDTLSEFCCTSQPLEIYPQL